MKSTKSTIVLLTAVLAIAAAGTGSADGSDGYVYGAGGYYWYNGQPYTRVQVLRTTPGYYTQGYYGYQYYPGQSYYEYQYQAVPNYVAPQQYAVPAPVYSKDWRTQVLEAAKAQQDHQQFMEAMRALSLPGSGYGGGAGLYGANATTQYGAGYSLQSLVKDEGAVNLDRAYLYQSQAVQGMQRLLGDAQAGQTSAIVQYGEQRNRVAEILAKAEVIKAANGPGEVTRTEYQVQSGVAAGGGAGSVKDSTNHGATAGNVDPPQRLSGNGGIGGGTGGGANNGPPTNQAGQIFAQVATARCVACHSGGTIKGGFDVTQYGQMPPERKQKVWKRLLNDSPEEPRMPLGKDGKPGKPLNADELRAFFNY